LLVALVAVPAAPASAGGSRHPHFNDRGTLAWYRSLSSAKAAARRQGKVIFIEYGRSNCGNCRNLAQNVLPHRDIRSRIGAVAIGLAADCDRPERSVWQLFRTNLPGARLLPFAAFITPDGQWITGWYGSKSVSSVSASLAQAERRVRAMRAPARKPRSRRPASTVRKAAPRHARQPKPTRIRPTPVQPKVTSTPAKADKTADDPSAGGACHGGSCRPPSFELPSLPNPFKLLAGGCEPRPACPPAACPPPVCPPPAGSARIARTPDGYGAFPPPAPRVQTPDKHLAEGLAEGPGSPDGEPTPRVEPAARKPIVKVPTAVAAAGAILPAPAVRKALPLPALPPTSALTVPDREKRAQAAAKRGDWAAVLLLTQHVAPEQAMLHALNTQAHRWAHGRLAFAVRATRQGKFTEADAAVAEVKLAMRGESESVDAARGADAIELMRDLDFLAQKSPVRKTVRKTAYEKMRGTRWAPLFSECPQPSAALTSR